MADNVFLSESPYDPAHPDSLAVYCSDGRFTRAVEELLISLGHDGLDTLTLPGGPALLAPSTSYSERETVSRAASFLIEGHHIKFAVLMAHEGCGYYRARFPGDDAASIEARQLIDLRAAREALKLSHPSLDICTYYLRVTEKQVQFDEI